MAVLDRFKAFLKREQVKKVENVRVIQRSARIGTRARASIVRKSAKRSPLRMHRGLAKRYGKKSP